MKLFTGIIFSLLVLGVDSESWLSFIIEAGQGAADMWRAYSDMKEANYKYSDKYFHARGNFEAAQRGPGGAWAARVLSEARESMKRSTGRELGDLWADRIADEWGRSGKDPDFFRPEGLPSKY